MDKTNKINNETREEKSTRENQWRPTDLLEAPQPREGYVQRWIATSILGQETPTNVARRMREGWKPRDPKSVKDPNGFSQIGLKSKITIWNNFDASQIPIRVELLYFS